jgi:hypothetical protein
MNSIKLMMLGMFLVLFIALATLAYISLNASVALDDARTEQRDLREQEHILQVMILQLSSRISRKELVQSMKNNFGTGHIIKEKCNQLEVDSVVLTFNDDVLTDVSSLSNAPKNSCGP